MRLPQGLGAWIVFGPSSGPVAVVDLARKVGLSHLFVKIADGTQDHASGHKSYHPFVRELVPLAAHAGIDVFSWSFIYDDPRAGRMNVEWSKALGCAGHCLDLEVEGDDGSARYTNNPTRALDLMDGAREAAGPDFPLGLTSYYNTRMHSSTPWQALLGRCDFHCPQVYNVDDPEWCLRVCYEDFTKPGWPPILPLWGNYNEPGPMTADHIRAFEAASRVHGATCCSIWEWESITADGWLALPDIAQGLGGKAEPMATGFEACHPDQVTRLQKAGITSAMVLQGVATTDDDKTHPSAGTHDSVGRINGRRFGHCIDLNCRDSAYPFTRAHYDALVPLGFAPFPRINWPDGDHWHVIDLTRPVADSGRHPDHLELVNHQLHDWITGLNGLVGDAPMPVEWRPTMTQREFGKQVWQSNVLPGEPAIEYAVTYEGKPVPCAPAMKGNSLAVNLGPLLPILTGHDLRLWRDTPEGDARCFLREIAEAHGLSLDTSAWPEVKLVAPTTGGQP